MIMQQAGEYGYKANNFPHNKRLWIVVSIIAVIFFFLIASPTQYYFLNDDFDLIPLAAKKHFVHGTLLRPGLDITLWFDHLIWAKNASGYHFTNTIIHIANTTFLYLLAYHFFYFYGDKEKAVIKSWLAALFFLLYSFHAEPIFWILGRGGSLSTTFFLSACIFYFKRHQSALYFLLALVFFGIGLLVYESVWIFPVICLFISIAEVFLKRSKWKKETVYVLSIGIFFLFYLWYRLSMTGSMGDGYELGTALNFNFSRLFYNYNTLLARTLLPPMRSSGWFLSLYIMLIATCIVTFSVIIRKRNKKILWILLLASFLIALLPPVSLGIDTHDSESERYIYLPSVLFILLVVEVLSLLLNDKKLFISLMFLTTLHSYYLFRVSLDYRFSGMVVRKSLEFIDEKTGAGPIYAIHLPTQYKGAFMFRTGFAEAVKWICTKSQNKQVIILSTAEFTKKREPYQLEERNIEEGIKLMQEMALDDHATPDLPITISRHTFSFSRDRDMILYWTDSTLVKIR